MRKIGAHNKNEGNSNILVDSLEGVNLDQVRLR